MATKPTSYLNWTDGSGSKITAPTAAQALSGWTAGEPMPFQYLNWLFYTTDQWIQWLDQDTNQEASDVNINASTRLINGGSWSWVAATGVLTWSSAFNLAIPSITDADNQAAAGNVTMTDGQVAYVASNLPFSATASTTNSSNQVTMAYTLGISVGMTVTGTGIPGSTTVTAIAGNVLTISNNATATGTPVLTFSSTGALTVTAATSSSLVLAPNTTVIARRVGAQVFVGINGSYLVLNDGESKTLLMGGFLTTSFFTAGQALTQGQTVYVSQGAGNSDQTITTGTTSGSSTALTVGSGTGLYVGMALSGTNIQAGTTISAIAGTAVTMSLASTGSVSGNVTCTRIAGQVYTLDCSSTYGTTRSNFVGFVMSTVAIGASVQTVTDGNMGGFTGLTIGAIYYGDPANVGGVTSTKTSTTGQWVVPVGMAMSATTIDINAGQAASAAQNIVPTSYPTYYVNSGATLTTAIAGCSGAGGGVICLNGAFTITAAYTIPANTLLLGQLGASVVTIGSGGTIGLASGARMTDVFLATTQASLNMLTLASVYSIVRGCQFTCLATSTVNCIYVTGSANRMYNNVFVGVAGDTGEPYGINYVSGVDNTDDSSVFLP